MGEPENQSQINDVTAPNGSTNTDGFVDTVGSLTTVASALHSYSTPVLPAVQPSSTVWPPTSGLSASDLAASDLAASDLAASHLSASQLPASDLPASHLAAMLLEAAAHFVDLPAAQFDQVISRTLDDLAAQLQMEHVGLSIVYPTHSPSGQQQLGVERRYVAGTMPLPSADELAQPYPWYSAQLLNGNTIMLPNGPDDLPAEAEAERAYLQAQGVQCTLVIPLRIGEQLIGTLYFNSTTHRYRWPAPDLHALTIFARVLAGAAQRKQSEETLRRHEEQLALAIDAAGVGIWSWDLEHPERSYGSDNLSKIHGIYPCPKELALQIYMSSLYPDDRAAMEQLFARCISGEIREFSAENRLSWHDGSVHWVEVRGYVLANAEGHPQRITGVLQEITRRKQVEAQLEEQRLELLRQARIMEQTEQLGEIGGWEVDFATNAYYWTPETYHIFGLSPTLYTPEPESALAHFAPASATMLRSAFYRATEFGENFDLKLQLHKARQATIWVRVTGHVETVDGKPVRIYGSIQDITLRTQIEEQLREAQKLEAIGQLAGGIAHDFNNLLTTINGMSELALLYLSKMAATTGAASTGIATTNIDRVRTYLSEIHRAGQRAAELTRQLLAFSRRQVLQPKVLDLRAGVLKIQELLQDILGENIELALIMPSHLGLVMADPSQIEQVITNLVINARHAMPDGGTLTIRLLNVTIDEAVARRQMHLPVGNYVLLEVEDTGYGMTPEVQARLFDPFFTTKGVGAGTGLGLATVYGIVKQSGGTIEVESEVGKGTLFRIFLPQSSLAPQNGKTTATYVRGGTETILLVGGDAWARQGYRVALEAKGYHLLDAASGREAISICQSYVGSIHLLVVSDVQDMSWVALANQMLLSRPEVKILLLESGSRMPTAQVDVPSGYFVLRSPFTPDALAAKLRSVLDAPAPKPTL